MLVKDLQLYSPFVKQTFILKELIGPYKEWSSHHLAIAQDAMAFIMTVLAFLLNLGPRNEHHV